jgi:predicted nucleotidyltransferase
MNFTQKLNLILAVLTKYLPKEKYQIYLFWSYAHWDARKDSDIDIFIDWKEKIPFRLKRKILEEIEELPLIVDIVFFDDIDDRFRKYIFKHWAVKIL